MNQYVFNVLLGYLGLWIHGVDGACIEGSAYFLGEVCKNPINIGLCFWPSLVSLSQ